jgi:ribonuclease-3
MNHQNELFTEEFILVEPPHLVKKDIENLIGTKINNIDIYQTAFTHKSALKKYTLTESFETLEFMGDSVLGFVITKFLFDKFKSEQEGFLTKARTKLVRGKTLSDVANKLELYNWILMDDKGMRNNWNRNPKILEDVFEALIGAIYMDIGLLHAKKFILNIFQNPEFVDLGCIEVDDNYKDALMRHCQTNKFPLPTYKIVSQNNGIFTVVVIVNNQELSSGSAKTKKQAEQEAAKKSLSIITNV